MRFDMNAWYQQHWQTLKQELFAQDSSWLSSLREQNLALFLEQGFPTKNREAWKYTDLSQLAQYPFEVKTDGFPSYDQQSLQKYYLASEHHRLVFINGHYCADLSQVGNLPSGSIIVPIHQALAQYAEIIQPFLQQPDAYEMNALNTTFMTDGAFIYLPKHSVLDKPIHLLFIALEASPQPTMHNVRNIIVADEQAEVTLIEDFQSLDEHVYFSNVITQIKLSPAARINYTKIQHENSQAFHLSLAHVIQAQRSHFQSHSFSIGSCLARDNLQVELNGAQAECELRGLYLLNQKQHIDHHTYINHNVPETISNEIYKGVVANSAAAVFNGKITVQPNAQKTMAQLRNQNLLLSAKAAVNTKPELEIYADDVKCSHGATIGEIDTKMLFYLRARGIDIATAYQMLIHAFINEITDDISNIAIAKKVVDELTFVIDNLNSCEQ